MEDKITHSKGLLSLSPMVVFLVMFVALSIFAKDFYAVPITVAFLVSCIYAVCIIPAKSIAQRIQIMTDGAGKPGLMLMIWIFILAGAFAATAKEMGAIDATVNLALTLLPAQLLLAGLFLAACFISLSIGTSVGTIAALVPIANGIATQTGQSQALLVAIVVGGAYFGDNLSFISDTTIVATKTQGCELSDKFRANIRIALPAALMAMLLYTFIGLKEEMQSTPASPDYLLVLPYIFVLTASIFGTNVLLVLTLGLAMAGGIGIWHGAFDLYGWMGAMSNGILGMSELIIVTLMAAGMIEAIRYTGGIKYILQQLSRHIQSRRMAELSMAALVFFTNLCTANNTIAILTVGPMAKDISQHYGVDPRRAASILDTFSCFAQGLIPYGAQMLIASGLAALNPLDIIPYLYYPFILGGVAILNILFNGFNKKIFPKSHS